VATSGHLGKGSASGGHAQGRRGARASAGIHATGIHATGIHATREGIGELGAVQPRIGDVLEEQVQMAKAFERS
jgi:hypothetical protein